MSTSESTTAQSFADLGLSPSLLKTLSDIGYESPSPIQAECIPILLQGRDLIGQAQTGTGKTAAFTLPLLQKMMRHENSSASPARHPVRALVLAPTRELADQVANSIKAYSKHCKATPRTCPASTSCRSTAARATPSS